MWIIALTLVLTALYLYFKYSFTYWERKGIPFVIPSIPFGNLKNVMLRRENYGALFYDLYKNRTEPFLGVYMFTRPVIFIRDAVLARKILIEDFPSFHDRGIYVNDKKDPTSTSLFNQTGADWKDTRSKLTPAFSSGKLKGMFEMILDVGKRLEKYIEPFASRGEEIDIKEDSSRFTLDVVASTIFGLDADMINNKNHTFRKMVKRLNIPGPLTAFRILSVMLAPQMMIKTGLMMLPGDMRKYFVNLIKETTEMREEKEIVRKDLMQLILQFRNAGKIQENEDWKLKKSSAEKLMTLEQISGQALVFYLAGSETSAAAMSFCLHELSQVPDKMKKLQAEIDATLKKYNGEITYDAVHEMKYLDMCMQETLRKFPGLPILNRQCTKDYQIPGTDHVIEKGTGIVISLQGIQNDPDLFPDADKFIPERFLNENGELNDKYVMPFGEGPRICIAMRMGKMVSKTGLVFLLSKYNFELTENSAYEFDKGSMGLTPANGIRLKVTKR